MNPTVYQIEKGGKIVTLKTCAGALGAALGIYPEARKGVSWKTEGKVTVVNGDITVTEIDIPLAWVKWGPA